MRLANTELTEKPDIEESINIFFEGVTLPKSKVIIKLELPALRGFSVLRIKFSSQVKVSISKSLVGSSKNSMSFSSSNSYGAALLKKKMHSLKSQEKRLANTELTEKPDIEESINIFCYIFPIF